MVKPLVAALAVLFGVVQPPVSAPDRISQQDFKPLFAAGKAAIVDVRDEMSYADAHIRGAILLPDHDVAVMTPGAKKIIAQLKTSNNPVIVYCACGGESSSLRVAKVLRDHGIRDARALVGGWVDWFNGGNPVVRGK